LGVVRKTRGAARAAEAERDERTRGLARGDVVREERTVGEARARECGLRRRAASVREVEGGRVARAGEEGVEERDGEDVDRAVAAVVGEVALVVGWAGMSRERYQAKQDATCVSWICRAIRVLAIVGDNLRSLL
jgi:hypothetical protein